MIQGIILVKLDYIEKYTRYNGRTVVDSHCSISHEILNRDLNDARAHCVKTGCLTRYGWFNKGAIESQYEC
ncbi:hypothetical protein PIROE2DRAFT_6032 [Piromyces sp. E2]|nr:hypothetical protein PIROE2DRAFT_6032 [Piromyces sp. E2]|eukprot:OUM66715.1 hypothetical protein PIROE2DRAFT_6032 [Piromyces sp. E2]